MRISCPGCQTLLEVADRLAGSGLVCSRCGQRLRVPQARAKPSGAPSRKDRPPVAVWLGAAVGLALLVAGAIWFLSRLENAKDKVAFAPDTPHEVAVTPAKEKPVPVEHQPPAVLPPRSDKANPLEPPAPIEEKKSDAAPPYVEETPKPTPPNEEKTAPPEKLAPPALAAEEPKKEVTVRDGIVFYPVDKQENVPLEFPGNEEPDPIPDAKEKLAGFPVTVTFTQRQRVRNVSARLLDGAGREIEAWSSAPDKPANPAHADSQQNTICVLAKAPLRPGTRYDVTITAEVNGKPWKAAWSFTTAPEDRLRQDQEQRMLDRLNAYRRVAGAEPVVLDRAKSRACAAHAAYLARNLRDRPSLNWREEKEDLPGYSVEGREVARVASIRRGSGAEAAAEWLAASCLNRGLALDPVLKKVGIGFARHGQPTWTWAIDLVSGREGRQPDGPQLFPAPDQKGVPTLYAPGEMPSPLPESARDKDAGYAITARFPFGTPITDVTATLADGAGKELPFWLSTPEKPAIPGALLDVICVIPRQPLQESRTYSVTLTAKVRGKAWKRSWSFTTMDDPAKKQDEYAAAILKAINTSRETAGLPPVELDAALSRGCLRHARYVVRNFDHPSVQGLGVHDEDPKLPGYTPEGRKAAQAAVIASLDPPQESVEWWMASFYHRIPILDPDLKRVGFGFALQPDHNWITVLDTGSGKASK
jgi:uncharacterized protein YkwD